MRRLQHSLWHGRHDRDLAQFSWDGRLARLRPRASGQGPYLKGAITYLLALGLLGWGAGRAVAGDSYWNNMGGGVFHTGGNWTGGVPGDQDNARFQDTGTYTVTWTNSVTNVDAYFAATGGIVTLGIGLNNTWALTNGLNVGTNAGANVRVIQSSGIVLVSNAAGAATMSLSSLSGTGRFEIEGGTEIRANRTTLRNNSSVTIRGGSRFYAGQADLGHWIDGNGNTITITGSNSEWISVGNTPQGGYWGANGAIVVSNGGRMSVINGNGGGSSHYGSMLITGTGSVYSCDKVFYINGTLNTVTVSDGAQLRSSVDGTGHFQFYAGPINNTVLITDPGTFFTNTGAMYFSGSWGPEGGNRFIVSNGATACSAGPVFLQGSTAVPSTNALIVTGTGSVFRTGSYIYFGDSDIPALVVTNGGSVFGLGGVLAGYVNQIGAALVTGSGSLWSNTYDVVLAGQNNSITNCRATLTVRNGARLFNRYGFIAYGGPAGGDCRGTMVVTDGGQWYNSDYVHVGSSAGHGTLIVSNTAMVASPTQVVLGNTATATGDLQVVGGTLTVTNASATGLLDVRRGSVLLGVGGLIRADNLTVTNNSSLRFNFTNESSGQIDLGSGLLKVDEANATLTVDLTGYEGAAGWRTLVTYGSMPVKFAEDKVIVLPGVSINGTVVQNKDGNKIAILVRQEGTVFVVR